MTLTKRFGKRLRRAALYSLLAVVSSGLSSSQSHAKGTQDNGVCCPPNSRTSQASAPSSELCGWIEVLSDSAKSSVTPKSARTVPAIPQFLSIDFDQELNIDTCNYGEWLADNLDASHATQTLKVGKLTDSAKDVDAGGEKYSTDDVCVGTGNGEPAAKANELGTPGRGSSVVSSRTSSEFNSTLATIAAAATAGNRIPFGHWTEPFAMIGPGGEQSPGQIAQFQNWYRAGKAVVDNLRPTEAVAKATETFVPLVDFEGELPNKMPSSVIADLVAIKTAGTGLSVLKIESTDAPLEFDDKTPADKPESHSVTTEEFHAAATRDSDTTDENRLALVGSSPVIASIKEAYLPYDLADRDRASGDAAGISPVLNVDTVTVDDLPESLLVWNDGLLIPSRSPFCVDLDRPLTERRWSPLRSEYEPAASPVASRASGSAETEDASDSHRTPVAASQNDSVTALDSLGPPAANIESAEQPKIASAQAPVLADSADCILDEWIWKVGSAMEAAESSDHWFRPKRIGQDVASLVVSGDRLASRIAYQLALVWPAKQRPVKPAPGIGARLLARAEAVERPAAELLPARELPSPNEEVQLAQARARLMQWVDVAHEVIEDWNQHLTDVPEVAGQPETQVDSVRR